MEHSRSKCLLRSTLTIVVNADRSRKLASACEIRRSQLNVIEEAASVQTSLLGKVDGENLDVRHGAISETPSAA